MACLLHQLIPAPMNISSFSSLHITRSFKSPHCCNSSSNCNSLLRFRLAIEKPKCGASEIFEINNELALPGGLDPALMPKHVSVIMDGNRRWAGSRGLFPQQGHKAGGEALDLIRPIFKKSGVKLLSVFAFSTENWARPKEEVNYLMKLFEEIIETHMEGKDGWRMAFLGDRSQLSESLQNRMSSAEDLLKGDKGPLLAMGVNYSGRYDIIQAARKIAQKVQNGSLQAEDINKNVFEQHLEPSVLEFPNPNLLIRTSGELRVSNYMMWQLANTELYFTNKMFPDLKEEDVVEALAEFQRRQRRRLRR